MPATRTVAASAQLAMKAFPQPLAGVPTGVSVAIFAGHRLVTIMSLNSHGLANQVTAS
jgi:hypothetical protein